MAKCKECGSRLQNVGVTGLKQGKQGLLWGWTCAACLSSMAAEGRSAEPAVLEDAPGAKGWFARAVERAELERMGALPEQRPFVCTFCGYTFSSAHNLQIHVYSHEGEATDVVEDSSPTLGLADEIRKMAALRDEGLLSDDEFDRMKRRLLE